MGILQNGLTSRTTGRVANLVTYELNGQNVLRSIGINNKPKTIPQLNNQLRMKVINNFFRSMDGFLIQSFGPTARGTKYNYQNLSIRNNMPNALKGYYPDVEIDYSKIIFSLGALPQPLEAKAEWTDEGVKFTWDTSVGSSWPECRDQVMMLIYFPDKAKNKRDVIYETAGAKRSAGTDILPVPSDYHDRPIEAYMTFVAEDRSDLCNSLYIGRLEPRI